MFLKDHEKLQLSKAVGYSWERLGSFRMNRLRLMQQYVGYHYGNGGSPEKTPVPLIELAMNIYLQRLVANAPKVMLTTEVPKLKEIATRFEIALNHLIEEIKLVDTLARGVSGAMFCMGVVKVGLNRSQVEIGGYLHDSGQPFADSVSLDNWVHDMTVGNIENVQFEGNYYYVTKDEAYDYFPQESHSKIVTMDKQLSEEEKGHDISEGGSSQREVFKDQVKLLDLWLPKQNLVLQCQASESLIEDPIQDVLRVIEWQGPEHGPYHKLGFDYIEDNTVPLAPAMQWEDLHDLANKLMRKLHNDSQDEKKMIGVQRGNETDGRRLQEADHNDFVALDNPQAAQEIRLGGISQENLGFLLTVKDLYVYLAGNLDVLGGLGAQSETLGQDQLLSASASQRIQRMQKKTLEWTKGIIKDLGYYLWTDPYINMPIVKRVRGFDEIGVKVNFGPEDRESDFYDYNFKIEPYSMQHQTPENKLQGLRTVFAEFVAPLLPQMQAQGVGLDIEKLFRTIGQLGHLPELNEVIVYSDPKHEPKAIEPGRQAPTTTRRYERVNRPGATNPGKSQIMQQALFGGKPQNSEISSLSRSTG